MTQQVRGSNQIMSESVGREEINSTTAGQAVIKKLIAGSGITIVSYTGADSGTGDVTIAASYLPLDGWQAVTETWTRTGNHTFTVSGDLTTRYRKGTKVKYNDGAVEYGVVGGSSHSGGTTTVNLIPNDDYAMANTTITGTYVSYIESPEGYPHEFDWTPTATAGGTGSPTFTIATLSHAYFKVIGDEVECFVRATGETAGSTVTNINMSVPFNGVSAYLPTGVGQINDGGTVTAARAVYSNSTQTLQIFKYDASNIGIGTGRVVNYWCKYRI